MKEMKTLKLPGQTEAYEIVDAKARELIGSHTHDEFVSSDFEFITVADIDEICKISSTFTFTISGVEYIAEEGMTWADWCDSDYNTDNYAADVWVWDNTYTRYVALNDDAINDTDVIVNGAAYVKHEDNMV